MVSNRENEIPVALRGVLVATEEYWLEQIDHEKEAWSDSIESSHNLNEWNREARLHAIHSLAAYYNKLMDLKEARRLATHFVDGVVRELEELS